MPNRWGKRINITIMNQKGFLSILGLIAAFAIILVLIVIWFKYYNGMLDNLSKESGIEEGTNILELPGMIEESQNIQRQKMEDRMKELENY